MLDKAIKCQKIWERLENWENARKSENVKKLRTNFQEIIKIVGEGFPKDAESPKVIQIFVFTLTKVGIMQIQA